MSGRLTSVSSIGTGAIPCIHTLARATGPPLPERAEPATATDLGERILRTLALADSRGYNLTYESLSTLLLGGAEDLPTVRDFVIGSDKVDHDDRFVGLKGRLWTSKCKRRLASNEKWGRLALSIASSFADEYARLNPDVRCVMLAGSAATGGFCDRDDIDLNIIVRDGTKYVSYVTALMLALKYSIRFGGLLGCRYFSRLRKVICINVVWEEGQVRPFARRDEQVAFELLNSVPIHNRPYYREMLSANPWIDGFFPQITQWNRLGDSAREPCTGAGNPSVAAPAATASLALEALSRRTLFALFALVWGLRMGQPHLRKRMMEAEHLKKPYGIFDDPSGTVRERAG